MKRITINSKTGYFLAFITGLVFMLSACSSDDTVQAIVDEFLDEEFVELKGKITSSENSGGENDVAVKGIYLDGNLLNAETVTANGGTFTLSVFNNIPVSLQASKTDFATLNSARTSYSSNSAGIKLEMTTTALADEMIGRAFPGLTLDGGQAWLAVNVVDNTGTEVDGAVITTVSDPDNMIDEAALDCEGIDSTNPIPTTIYPPCDPERDGPMYLAYFSADTEVSVTVDGVAAQQTAPVRVGQVTYLEFTK
jgi:hypothetical protein